MIEVKNLYLSYIKEYYALYNINFEVGSGERVAILGDVESGKTTLLRSICGLEKIDKGEVYLNKINIKKVNFSKDLELVYLSNKPVFFENKSVFYNLSYVLKIRKVSDNIINKKINNALKLLDIEYLKEKKIKDLNSKEKLLVQLARAGLREASIYLIDDIFEYAELNHIIVEFLNAVINKEASCLFALSLNNEDLIEKLSIDKIIKLASGSIVK